jgi:hypothetical protein
MIMVPWIENTKKRSGRMAITDNVGYIKLAMTGLLTLLAVSSAAFAESKFLSLK